MIRQRSLFFFLLLSLSFLFGETDYPMDNAPLSKDEEILREWLETKRIEPLSEKKAQLCISGEVRTMMRATSATRQNPSLGINQGLYGSLPGFAVYDWINRVALYFDYSAYLAWAHAKVKFDNAMGSLGGTTDAVTLEEGYLGYRVLEDGKSIFDMFVGRTKLYTLFDSDIQFNALMDGLILRYENEYSGWVHLQANWAGSLINSLTEHYGWAAQLSFTKLFGTGLYTRFSFTDWQKKSPTQVYEGDGDPAFTGSGAFRLAHNNPQFAFHIAQYLIGYEGQGHFPFRVWAAVLINHAAIKKPALDFRRKQSVAWYVSGSVGRIQKRGDMAFNISYQYVGAQAVPGWDMAGIGLGNPQGSSFYYPSLTSDPAPFGNTNFKGVEANYLVGLSENMALLIRYQRTKSAVSINHWRSRYQRMELSAVYAF